MIDAIVSPDNSYIYGFDPAGDKESTIAVEIDSNRMIVSVLEEHVTEDMRENPHNYKIEWFPVPKPVSRSVWTGEDATREFLMEQMNAWEQRQYLKITGINNHLVLLYRYAEATALTANKFRSANLKEEYPLIHGEIAVTQDPIRDVCARAIQEYQTRATIVAAIATHAKKVRDQVQGAKTKQELRAILEQIRSK